MKRSEKDEAINLRKKGLSLNEIVSTLHVSKASVSNWVRHIELTEEQRFKLNKKGFSIDAIEKRRINRINKTTSRHKILRDAAKSEIESISQRELFLIGVALYWGEGSKKSRGQASVANSDPAVIAIMMRFFREICSVPEEKFRGHIHTFSHLNTKDAEKYWSGISGIPLTQFFKTYSKPSKASQGKRDTLPYGTLQICICDTALYLKVMGYIERLSELSYV